MLISHLYFSSDAWELTSWEVDLVEVDLVGVDLVGGHYYHNAFTWLQPEHLWCCCFHTFLTANIFAVFAVFAVFVVFVYGVAVFAWVCVGCTHSSTS